MSSTINMTGKPTTGGGGKGGGESKFERLWHQVLRDPNPSTIRTFKELFDVADPSQTLFGGGKGAGTGTTVNDPATKLHRALLNHEAKLQRMIQTAVHTRAGASRVAHQYSNVQRLKGIAAHVGVPLENTFSTMEGHVGKNYRNWMRDHQSAIRLQRTYAPSGPMNAHVAARDRHLAAQEAQARFNATHPMNAHVAARDRHLAAQEAQARFNATHPMNAHVAARERYAANQFAGSPAGLGAKYRSGMLTSAIGGAEGAVAVGGLNDFRKQYRVMNKLEKSAERQVALLTSMNRTDDKELSLAQQHLAQVKSAKSHYASMGQARWGKGATRHTGPGMSGYLEDALGASVLGDIIDPLAIGATAAIATGVGAYKLTDMIGGVINSEKPYTNTRLLYSRIAGGLGLGVSGGTLLNQFYKGGNAPAWMQKLGLKPDSAGKFMQSYGITGYTSLGEKKIVEQLRGAQLHSRYLRGLPTQELAGMAQLGVVTGLNPSTTDLQPILRDYYRTIEKGTAAGIDRATSIKTMSGAVKSLLGSGMGAATMGGSYLSRFVANTLGSGLPSFRNGTGQISLLQSMQHNFHNVLNNPVALTTLDQMMLSRNHGKLPYNAAGLANVLGPNGTTEVANLNKNFGGRTALHAFYTLMRSGNVMGAMASLKGTGLSIPFEHAGYEYMMKHPYFARGSGYNSLAAAHVFGKGSIVASSTLNHDLNTTKHIGVIFSNTAGASLLRMAGSRDVGRLAPLGARFNNPGDLMPGGILAKYKSPLSGVTAMERLLHGRNYFGSGLDTVASIITKYAPPKYNNTAAYIRDVSGWLKLQPNAKLNLNNPNTLALFSMAMARQEGTLPYFKTRTFNTAAGMITGAGSSSTVSAIQGQQACQGALVTKRAEDVFNAMKGLTKQTQEFDASLVNSTKVVTEFATAISKAIKALSHPQPHKISMHQSTLQNFAYMQAHGGVINLTP